jgi:hypothetical protein
MRVEGDGEAREEAGDLGSAAFSSDRHAELPYGPARRLTECDGHTARTFSDALAYPWTLDAPARYR